MTATLTASAPTLSCEDARLFEERRFKSDETAEWQAMQSAGSGVAAAIIVDFEEIGGFPSRGRILVLAGKGHNGGDALIAAQTILERFPEASADVVFPFGERPLRPLAQRAWRDLVHAGSRPPSRCGDIASSDRACGSRVPRVNARRPGRLASTYDLVIDGVFGFQFRPPLDPNVVELLAEVNAKPVGLRAAVDLPSGFGEMGAFRADFTYATGVLKRPLLELPNAGRLRLIDLGWSFAGGMEEVIPDRVLLSSILSPLNTWRPPRSDKRDYGHLAVVGGSRRFPGAILMTVQSALRSGVGLLTAFVPESLAPSFAARVPEAMWVGWPETPDGGLALEGARLLRERLDRATALVMGPGMGREAETLAWALDAVREATVPLVIDADALQPAIVSAGSVPRVLTPHGGEFSRIQSPERAGGNSLGPRELTTLVLKGPITKVISGDETYYSLFGGPVLARGGSGDLLAGMIGAQLAQNPTAPLLAAARGVVWHGLAADLLARDQGATAVSTTQLLDYLPAALRHGSSRD